MKILQLVFDGFSPYNNISCLDVNQPSLDKYVHTVKSTTDPKNRNTLNSQNMWCRIYSRIELGDQARFNPDIDEDDMVRNKYAMINTKQLIWNRLAELGTPSFILPYGSFSMLINSDTFISTEHPEYISAYVRKYQSARYSTIKNGEVTKGIKSEYEYHPMNEVGDHMYLDKPELHAEVQKMWKSGDYSFVSKLAEDLHDEFYFRYLYLMNENKKVLEEELYPMLREFNWDNGGFVSLGLAETDTLYHFATPYTDIVNKFKRDMGTFINTVVEILDPDVVFIHGDHNMVEPHNRNTYAQVTYDGDTHNCTKASFSICPFYHDHGNKVEGLIYAKTQELLNSITPYFDRSAENLFMDNVYDYVLDINSKKNS